MQHYEKVKRGNSLHRQNITGRLMGGDRIFHPTLEPKDSGSILRVPPNLQPC
jgi:hypothetical protein